MNPYSIINIFSSVFYLFLGIFAVRLEPGSKQNRLFLLINLCFSLWAFCFAFIHDASVGAAARETWYNISAIGWCLFGSFSLHFILLLVRRDEIFRKRWIFLFLYGPGLLLIIREWTGTLGALGFIRVGWGVSELPPINTVWYGLFLMYQSGFTAIGIALLFLWWHHSVMNRERRQARLLAVTSLASLTIGFGFDILLPSLGIFLTPALSPVAALILAIGFWVAITRYKLMSFNLASAAGDIVMNMQDLMILVGADGRIVKINNQVTKILGSTEKEILHRHFVIISNEQERLLAEYKRVTEEKSNTFDIEIDLVTADGAPIPMRLHATMLLDRFNDRLGLVLVARDLREQRQLHREIAERRLAEEYLRQRNEVMERDLVNAQFIQKALLPASAPVHRRLKSDFRHLPMDAVGGDFFAFTAFPGGELGVFIGDVSGHGVSAALFLSLLKAEFDRTCRNCGLEPRRFIVELNRSLTYSMHGFSVTALYGIFTFGDNGRARFTFSKGGHPEPVLFRASTGESAYHACRGPLLGTFLNAEFDECIIELERGDRVFVYTDGLTETRNEKKEMYGFSRMAAQIERQPVPDLSDALDGIIGTVTAFRGGFAVEDDIVLVGFEVC